MSETSELDGLWKEFKATGAASARERLILHYAPLVKYVVGRLATSLPPTVERVDLMSYGLFGLMDALDAFDPSEKGKFESYAIPRIKGAVIEELRAIGWAPRSPGTHHLRAQYASPMFERFTDRARRVVVFAQEEARLLNHNHIGTEHLLLGLIREGEGVAAKTLESLGIALETVRREVELIIGEGPTVPTGHIPFTPRAKKVLELALRESVALGHNYLGTEHILLGLVREGEGVAPQVLQKLGADAGRVREQVIELLAGYIDPLGGEAGELEERYASPMFERFTEKARRVVVLAQEESRELGHDHIGTEHLLLALIREEDGIAGKALAEAGITLDEARRKVEELAPRGEPEPKRRSGKRWRRHVDFTGRAKKTMELSLREALGLGHNYIGTEHLLLGLMTLGEGTGLETLSGLGAESSTLRESVLALTESQPEEEHKPSRGFREADFEIKEAPAEESSSPRCPRCRSDLAETAAVRTLDLPLHEGEGTRAVSFAFCQRCGTWLGTVAG